MSSQSEEEPSVEVKIGVQHTSRELSLESAQSPDEVADAVSKVIADAGGVLTLVDEKGRKVIVPAAKIAYVEIAEATQRRVGFTAS
jgi:hypothetical protein